MKYIRFTAVVVLVLAGACQAQAADKAAVQQAQRSFDAMERGKFILGYLEMGAQYKDHNCIAVVGVADSDGKRIPGHFCLRYQFDWAIGEYDNTTTVDLLFDEKGRFYDVNNEKSTSVVWPPYAVANGTIKLLGAVFLEAFKKDLKPEDKKFIQDCIDKADARGMLEVRAGLPIQRPRPLTDFRPSPAAPRKAPASSARQLNACRPPAEARRRSACRLLAEYSTPCQADRTTRTIP